MQLIKIYPDRVQIKSDNNQLGDIRINDAMLVSDTQGSASLVCVVTAIFKNEDVEQFDIDGGILEPETSSTIECGIVGSLVGGRFEKSVDRYPTTNVTIQPVTERLFREMLGGAELSGFVIGKYSAYDCPAVLDGNKFFQRHSAIVGNTGSGKSCAVANMLEKLDQLPGANVILFDLHGEYAGLSYCDAIQIGEGGLDFPVWFLPLRDIYGNLLRIKEETAQVQVAALRKAFYRARARDVSEEIPISFDTKILLRILREENEKEVSTGEFYKSGDKAGLPKMVKGDLNGKLGSVISLLEDKRRDKRYEFMFRKQGQEYLSAFVGRVFGRKDRRIKVIDLSHVPSDMVPTVIAVTARLLYRVQLQQEKREIVPMTLICDEAHVYIPSNDFGLSASQRRLLDIFETIAKEGRKFGVSLLVVSQRPSDVNRTILAQCANYVVLKLSNDGDKQMIKGILPEGSKGIVDSVNLFRSGDCLVIGDSASITFKVRIDLPRELPSSNTIETWEKWSEPRPIDTNELTERLLNSEGG